MQKTAQKEFNKKDNLIVVSSYPDLKDGSFSNVSGVATYTYHMLPDLSSELEVNNRKVVVLSDRGSDEKAGIFAVWKRKTPRVFGDISRAIRSFSRVDRVLFHFEFNMYADLFITGLLPFYLWRLKVINKKDITLMLHQVVEDLDELGGHLNLKSGSFKSVFLNFALRIYYKLLSASVSKIVVHDEILRHRLEKMTNTPIFVIPHGLGEYEALCDREDARSKLGLSDKDFIVLCFGFLTWYKGSDWAAEQFTQFYNGSKDASVKLILAGGKSPTLAGMPHYDKYFEDLVQLSSEYPNIQITGFVPEDNVHLYYCAADIVLLPYRTQMSASGPFSIGLSFGRPFLLSENLEGVLETADVKALLKKYGLKKKDVTFRLNGSDLFNKIAHLVENTQEVEKLAELSLALSQERNWKRVVKQFLMVIDA